MKFNEMLETFGLKQHVSTPTHSPNHILDLLITRSTTNIKILSIVYRKMCNRYCHLLNKARTDYYSTLINDNSHDPKKLYRIVNSLCAAPQEDPLPPHNDLGQLANTFNEFFFAKMN